MMTCVAQTPDTGQIIAGGSDGILHFMDTNKMIIQESSCKSTTVVTGKKIIKCMLFHEGVVYVGVGDGDGTPKNYRAGEIVGYNYQTHKEVARFGGDDGHKEGVTGIAISKKNNFLISVSGQLGEQKGGTCMIWDLKDVHRDKANVNVKKPHHTILGGDPDARDAIREKTAKARRSSKSLELGGELWR